MIYADSLAHRSMIAVEHEDSCRVTRNVCCVETQKKSQKRQLICMDFVDAVPKSGRQFFNNLMSNTADYKLQNRHKNITLGILKVYIFY